MNLTPFSFLNLFSLSSFKGLNWFEGLKRIKVFLQWLWGIPSGLIFVFFVLTYGARLGILLLGFIAVALPILGFELLFRAVVWIVAGFMNVGDSKTEVFKPAQSQLPFEVKKKIADRWSRLKTKIRNTKIHHVLWAIFLPVWFYIWFELVTKTSLCPITHWKNSGFSYPLKNISDLEVLRLLWYVFLTILRAFVAFFVLLGGYHLYLSFEAGFLLMKNQRETSKS